MLYFNYLFIKLLILYLYTTVNYCVEFTDFIRNLIRPQGHEKRRGSRKEEVWDREREKRCSHNLQSGHPAVLFPQ